MLTLITVSAVGKNRPRYCTHVPDASDTSYIRPCWSLGIVLPYRDMRIQPQNFDGTNSWALVLHRAELETRLDNSQGSPSAYSRALSFSGSLQLNAGASLDGREYMHGEQDDVLYHSMDQNRLSLTRAAAWQLHSHVVPTGTSYTDSTVYLLQGFGTSLNSTRRRLCSFTLDFSCLVLGLP